MSKVFLIFILLLASLKINAQSSITHTVQRGETIESVARKYGLTVEELQQANPNTKELFYAGMKLTIPRITSQVNNPVQGATTPTSNTYVPNNNPKSVISSKNTFNDMDRSRFTSVGLTFGCDLASELIYTNYGIMGQYFMENGLGATLSASTNLILDEAPDYIIKIGPSYVYPISNLIYVMGTLNYTLTIAETEYSNGMISGASFIPTIGLSLNQLKVGLNLEVLWRNSDTFGFGGFLNASYSF